MQNNNIVGNTISQTILAGYDRVINEGTYRPSRNGGCTSIFDTTFEITNPRSRHLYLEGRKSNIFALIAETFWVMAGDDRVNPYLSFFLPRAPDYSDDGVTWHGCFTGDTKVKLLDGRDVAMIDLKKEFESGKVNYVYSWSNDKGWVPGEIVSAHVSKKTKNLIKIKLDNGEYIKCTLDHKFMMRDGSYKEAKDLVIGSSLMPIYDNNSLNIGSFSDYAYGDGYHILMDNRDSSWQLTHKVIFSHTGKDLVEDIHHVDFNQLNNSPDNLTSLTKSEHKSLHSKKFIEYRSNKIKLDPEYREIQAQYSRTNAKLGNQSQREHLDKNTDIGLNLREVRRNNSIAINSNEIVKEKQWLGRVKKVLDMEGDYEINRKTFPNSGIPTKNSIISKYGSMEIASSRIDNLYAGAVNHKVASIEIINELNDIEVYDLSINNEEHNFALSSGVVVHNSYGPRFYRFNQHLDALDAFVEDGLYTRRSFIQISMPDLDNKKAIEARYGVGHKARDIPCNREINFYVGADNKFSAKTVQRSGDMIFGTGSINPFEFSFLHELMYNEVRKVYPDLELGAYRWHVTNAHLYDWSKSQADAAYNNSMNYVNYNENNEPLIAPDIILWKSFFTNLVRLYTEVIESEDEQVESLCKNLVYDLGHAFISYNVPMEGNLLWTYAKLVAHYIGAKKNIQPVVLVDVGINKEFSDSILKSSFRKFEVIK